MQEDLRGHLVRVFYNLLGFWPNSNKLSTFGQFCNELMVQCPCNHMFGTFIYNIMVGYHDIVRPKGFPIDLRKTLVSAMPEGFILTISDKGLGPVLKKYPLGRLPLPRPLPLPLGRFWSLDPLWLPL